ncbi:uncharacterized protein LOC142339221 [Convolutriloba macropyga]|uniref:uncharacterized protein LOC142339221 n=1 Tax=Convolutriloba macropyga TaxID=536237 RepID=UPI003F51C241
MMTRQLLVLIIFILLREGRSELSVSMEDVNIEIDSGQTLTIVCNINNAPDQTEIIWMFNGNQVRFVQVDTSLGGFNYESKITITNVTKDHSGTYFCLASNEIEAVQSSAASYVKVKYKPVSLMSGSQQFRILERFPTKLVFDVDGYPEPDIYIYHNSIELNDAYDKVNQTLTLPYLTLPIETIARNSLGATEIEIDYEIICLIESRSIIVHTFSTHFEVKLASDVSNTDDDNSILGSPVYLVLVEEFTQERFKTPPIDIDLKGFASCNEQSNDLIHNIVSDLQTSARTDQTAIIDTKFLPQILSKKLTPDTRYLLWVLESRTFICPDGEHYAITQATRASDYLVSDTLPAAESQGNSDSKVNEILLSIIITIAAIFIIIILVSITILITSKYCRAWRGTKTLQTGETQGNELSYFTNPRTENGVLDTTASFVPVDVGVFQNLTEQRPVTALPQQRALTSTPMENVYCMPDEYGNRDTLQRPVSRNGLYGNPGIQNRYEDAVMRNGQYGTDEDFMAKIARPVYLATNSSSMYDINASPIEPQGQPTFLNGYTRKYASCNEINAFDNQGFHHSDPKMMYFNLSPRFDEERIRPPENLPTPYSGSNLEHPRNEFQKAGTRSNVEHGSSGSTGSSSRAENASRSSDYYNFVLNPLPEHATLQDHDTTPRLFVTNYEKHRNRANSDLKTSYIPENRPGHYPQMRSFRLFDQMRGYKTSTSSLPELVTQEHRNDMFNSLPRDHRSLGGGNLQLALRSQSTTDMNSQNFREDEYFYLQI